MKITIHILCIIVQVTNRVMSAISENQATTEKRSGSEKITTKSLMRTVSLPDDSVPSLVHSSGTSSGSIGSDNKEAARKRRERHVCMFP